MDCFLVQNGGGTSLNFKVVGNPQPSNPKENTIWVNTDTGITSWIFSAEEPNGVKVTSGSDAYMIMVSHELSEGDILNLTIPATVSSIFEAIRIYDASHNVYFVRTMEGEVWGTWSAGTKVSIRISSDSNPVGNWGTDGGTAYLVKYGSWSHDEGMVWISTGTSSRMKFNALKKNDIQVYPLSAKQYVGGTWVNKKATTYQNGEWVDWWDGALYKDGDQCTDITGGWSANNYIAEQTVLSGEHASNHMFFDGRGGGYATLGTQNPISLEGISTIRIIGNVTSNYFNGSSWFGLSLSVLAAMDFTRVLAHLSINTVEQFDKTLDVSNLNDEYYIAVRAEANESCDGYVTGVYVS